MTFIFFKELAFKKKEEPRGKKKKKKKNPPNPPPGVSGEAARLTLQLIKSLL